MSHQKTGEEKKIRHVEKNTSHERTNKSHVKTRKFAAHQIGPNNMAVRQEKRNAQNVAFHFSKCCSLGSKIIRKTEITEEEIYNAKENECTSDRILSIPQKTVHRKPKATTDHSTPFYTITVLVNKRPKNHIWRQLSGHFNFKDKLQKEQPLETRSKR